MRSSEAIDGALRWKEPGGHMEEKAWIAKMLLNIEKAVSGDTLALAMLAEEAVSQGLYDAEEKIQKLQAENASLRAQLKDALAASKTEAAGE